MAAGLDSYLRGARARSLRQTQADAEAAVRALAVARELAQLLAERYGARRVVLAGSLARGEFREGSDIDLVAEGLDDAAFFRAGADVEAAAGDIPVDLVPLESATDAFRLRVFEEGVVLHDTRG